MAVEQQHISIGLIGYSHAWASILDQIGIPWKILEPTAILSTADHSVIICNTSVSPELRNQLHTYVTAGGAVLHTTASAEAIFSRRPNKRFCTSLPPVSRTTYCYADILDLHAHISFFEDDSLISVERTGTGILSFLGIDLEIFTIADSARRGFYSDRPRLPHEIVAKRPLNPLRQLIQSHLEYLHHQRGLPFIHTWFFPNDASTVFTFRIDSDKGTQEQIEEIYQLSEQQTIPTTWFLDVKSHESWLPYFSQFSRQEIGVHCYEHVIYNSMLLNKENFGKALELLRKYGFSPSGLAAPTGAWNNAVGRAIQELDLSYSSEFSYDYDGLPSFPLVNGTFSTALQLPMHPMCIGTMRREQMTPEEMFGYFRGVIDKRRALREPVCLYHHPGHETNSVFQKVFQYINELKILPLSYSEYASWWKRRAACRFTAVANGSEVILSAPTVSVDTCVRISLPGGLETITVPNGTVRLADVNHIHRNEYQTPADIMRARGRNVRHYIQNALDWWIKTTE